MKNHTNSPNRFVQIEQDAGALCSLVSVKTRKNYEQQVSSNGMAATNKMQCNRSITHTRKGQLP
jgi:hypothetical protein